MSTKEPYKIEITDEERAFLYGALNLVDNAISGVPYESSTAIIELIKWGYESRLFLFSNKYRSQNNRRGCWKGSEEGPKVTRFSL
jgi:hypothetical protein